jgi:thiol-disulfide isomerase/thioredoxin
MELTKDELVSKINAGEKMVVDFYSTTCGPCKMLKHLMFKMMLTMQLMKLELGVCQP